MNCSMAQQLLQAVAEGGLSGEKARTVRRHFASCDECASKLTPSQWVEVLPSFEEEVDPSADFALRFHQRLEQRRVSLVQGIFAWRRPKQLAFASAMVAVFVIGMLIGRYPGEKPEEAFSGGNTQIAEKIPIIEEMALISNLELLEDFEAIEDLPALLNEESEN